MNNILESEINNLNIIKGRKLDLQEITTFIEKYPNGNYPDNFEVHSFGDPNGNVTYEIFDNSDIDNLTDDDKKLLIEIEKLKTLRGIKSIAKYFMILSIVCLSGGLLAGLIYLIATT